MQVDPTLMNVGDGGTVSREISAPTKASTTMVGNPPQTLPPEFRGDVTLSQQNKATTTTDCKTARVCPDTSNYNHSLQLSPPQQLNHASMSGPVLRSSENRADTREDTPKLKSDALPAPHRSTGVKVSPEDSLESSHGLVTSKVESEKNVPPGFQHSVLKPAHPVAFLPPANFSSPLCKIALPPALGQIAASRESAASQYQKDIQPQSSGVAGSTLMQPLPFPFQSGAPDKKISKPKSNHSTCKTTKSAGELKTLASAVASPTMALPLQHPSLTSAAPTCYTLSPTAAICCGSALASITSQSRKLNHVEKNISIDKTPITPLKTIPPAALDHCSAVSCTFESGDVPLDLSAKSKRTKCVVDSQVSKTEAGNKSNVSESNRRDFLNSKSNHSSTYTSAVPYPVLPNTHKNGSNQKQLHRPQNHQVTEPKPLWCKGSPQDPIKNIPGTYVGVASPILASTLRGKDGTFGDDFQSFAKQELISIIDQGEHLASVGKKPSCLTKCNKHAQGAKHVKNTSTSASKNCPAKGALLTALSSSTNILQKSATIKSQVPFSPNAGQVWQQSSHHPHPAFSVPRKIQPGSPKATTGSGVSKFHGARKSPPKTDSDRWDSTSPLSNLASIVKQQTLEATVLAGTVQAGVLSSRLADSHTLMSDSQLRNTNLKSPLFCSVEKRACGSFQGDSSNALKILEKVNAIGTLDACTDIHTSKQVGAKNGSSKPTGHSHPARGQGSASTNGNRMESKLAQVLEGTTLKTESNASDNTRSEKYQGIVASILTSQRSRDDKFEKTTNGTKEESPTKAKAAAIKQKNASPKKPVKVKASPDLSKKAAEKRKQDSPNNAPCQKKLKKPSAPVLEESLSAGKQSLQSAEQVPAEKARPCKTEQSTATKQDAEVSSERSEAKNTSDCNESDSPDISSPRLRKGRRRADEARHDLWGFATPSPPPPNILLLPTPPSPPSTPTQPARRPRGRPRSKPLPDQTVQQNKGKTDGDSSAHKKRKRYRSKKYQTGDYITEKLEDGETLEESDSMKQEDTTAEDSHLSPAASSPDPSPRRPPFTRSGSVHYQDSELSPERPDKPSGKRKFKSKHLCDGSESKTKTKHGSLTKRAASLPLGEEEVEVKREDSTPPSTKSLLNSPTNNKRNRDLESPPKRPIPPEVRRLIVNKNAGETLLQRAARLGYQEVVLYCLEKDVREVNRRDNAGYTALHEACSRGWTQIVEILLKHGADVNCSSQDGTRPLHDAVASDNLPIVWLLLNHGADPTLATYSGHTPVKLAHSQSMKDFLSEYFTDLEGRGEQDPQTSWEFYSSSLFETEQEPCWDFLLTEQDQEQETSETKNPEVESDKDCLVFELSSEPLLPCYHVQVSLAQGFCNWFLLADVVKRLKVSERIFQAQYPHLEVVSISRDEFCSQVLVSQVSSGLASPRKGKSKDEEEDGSDEDEGLVNLVKCVPELQRLLGSSIHFLDEEDEEEDEQTRKSR
ncbi:uncharacterized protein bcorl1 isoform 1-T4 [Synchiropus picturatus]